MKKIEKLLIFIAYVCLIGGIVIGFLVSKGIIESNTEMCVPQAVAVFVGALFGSVGLWALLTVIVHISETLRKIKEKIEQRE